MTEFTQGDQEYVSCDAAGCKKFATLHNAAEMGWDWFTGSLPKTVHFCKKHTSSAERSFAFARSQKENQP